MMISYLLLKRCAPTKKALQLQATTEYVVSTEGLKWYLALIWRVLEFKGNIIRQYQSLKDYREGHYEAFAGLGQISQIEANQTGFTALTSTGQVYTWGDERYGECLGREITKEK